MTRTLIDIDDEALAAAARELGTSTKVETVNRALADIAGRAARVNFVAAMATAEHYLDDETAWR